MGYDQLTYYSLDIFRKADMAIDEYLLAIVLQTAPVFGYIVASILLARIGRRVQLITFGVLFSFFICTLGANLFILEHFKNVRP